MKMDTDFQNMIIGNDQEEYFSGCVFDDFIFNETKLTEFNWLEVTDLKVENLETPLFNL